MATFGVVGAGAARATPRLYCPLPGRARRARRRVGRALGVHRPPRCLPPALAEDQFGQRPPPHWAVPSLRPPDGDRRHQLDLLRDLQQGAQLGLGRVLPPGHDAAVSQGAGAEEEVLAGRVQRRRVGGGPVLTVRHVAGEDQHGHGLVGVDVVLHGACHARLGRVGPAARPRVVAVGRALGGPEAARSGADEALGLLRHHPVGQDDEAEGLAVGAARGPCGREEDVAQRLVGDRLVRVAPDGPRGEQPLVEGDVVCHAGYQSSRAW